MVEIETPATREQAENASRIEAIMSRIVALSDADAIAQAATPPVPPKPGVQAAIDARDPAGARSTNGGAARQILQMLTVLTEKDAESIRAWEESFD